MTSVFPKATKVILMIFPRRTVIVLLIKRLFNFDKREKKFRDTYTRMGKISRSSLRSVTSLETISKASKTMVKMSRTRQNTSSAVSRTSFTSSSNSSTDSAARSSTRLAASLRMPLISSRIGRTKGAVALLEVRKSVSRLTATTVIQTTVLIGAIATTSCVFKFVKRPFNWTGPEARAPIPISRGVSGIAWLRAPNATAVKVMTLEKESIFFKNGCVCK